MNYSTDRENTNHIALICKTKFFLLSETRKEILSLIRNLEIIWNSYRFEKPQSRTHPSPSPPQEEIITVMKNL